MTRGSSYADVMARRGEIVRESVGLDYARYETGGLAFDYERLLPGKQAIDHVREEARDLGLVPENGVTVRITGNVALNTEEMIGVARGGTTE